MATKKVEINEESLIHTLNLVVDNIIEERQYALDRFRRQDENIDSNEQFMLQGKTVLDFLKSAQDSTEKLFNIVKLQASIVHKNALTSSSSSLSDDDIKKEIQKQITQGLDDIEGEIK